MNIMYIIINNHNERVFPINLCKTLIGMRKRISRMFSIRILTFKHQRLFSYNNIIYRNKNIFILVTSVKKRGGKFGWPVHRPLQRDVERNNQQPSQSIIFCEHWFRFRHHVYHWFTTRLNTTHKHTHARIHT